MRKKLSLVILGLVSAPASAHHPLAGMPMETFAHGLLSGVGHPLLGFDHLFFVILVGIAAVLTRHRLLAPLSYITTMLMGCLVSALWTSIPVSEFMIALSLLLLGSMLLSGHNFESNTTLIVFAVFGLFHGAAFGTVIAAQEVEFSDQVLPGYLLGLGFTQYAISLAAGWVCLNLWKSAQSSAIQPRLAGAMVAGAGLYLTLEHLEGPLLRTMNG